MVAAGMFSTVAALIASTVLAAAALGLWLLRTDDPVAGSAILAASGLALSMAAAIAAVTQVVHLTAFSHDSIQYLTTASVLERLGSLDPVPSIELLKRQLAAPLLHTVGTVTGLGYVAFWTPLIGVATVGVTAWFANALLVAVNTPKRYRVALVVGGLAFLLTASQFLKSVFLVNGHMLFAGLVIAGIGLTWLGVTSNRTSAFAIAGVALAVLVTLRPDGVIVVGVIARAHRDHATGWASGPLAAGRACGWRDIALVRGGGGGGGGGCYPAPWMTPT